jgi:hypothetical protein
VIVRLGSPQAVANIVKDSAYVREFRATVLNLLGVGQPLIGVEPAHVVPDLLA